MIICDLFKHESKWISGIFVTRKIFIPTVSCGLLYKKKMTFWLFNGFLISFLLLGKVLLDFIIRIVTLTRIGPPKISPHGILTRQFAFSNRVVNMLVKSHKRHIHFKITYTLSINIQHSSFCNTERNKTLT